MKSIGYRLSGLASPLLLLLAWHWAASAGLFPANLLIAPAAVWQTFIELCASGELPEHLAFSLLRLAQGFAFGSAAGLGFGLALALSPRIEAYCAPLFHTLRQLPSLALIPMFVLLFGIEELFKVAIVALTVFFPVALATAEAVRHIPQRYLEVARVYRLPWYSLLLGVALPAATPGIVTGLRIALTRAWVVLVACELLAADSGLGQMIEMGRQMLRIDVVMVGVVVTGVIGFTLDVGLRRVERRLSGWQSR